MNLKVMQMNKTKYQLLKCYALLCHNNVVT